MVCLGAGVRLSDRSAWPAQPDIDGSLVTTRTKAVRERKADVLGSRKTKVPRRRPKRRLYTTVRRVPDVSLWLNCCREPNQPRAMEGLVTP